MKNRLLVLGVASLGVVAAAGWLRTPQPAVATQANAVPAIYSSLGTEQAQPYLQPVAHRFAGARVDDGYRPRIKARRSAPQYRAADDDYRYRSSEPVYKTRRSTKKSVAIVAGSSAAGAAIGALAGGGKGAAIGAISAGVGGLLYDRVTR